MIEDISSAVIGFIVIVAIVFLLRMIGLLFEWLGKKKKDTLQTPQRKDEDWVVVVHKNPQRKVAPPTPRVSSLPPTIPVRIPASFDYNAEWWKTLSQWYRNKKDWTCEMCGLDLKGDNYFLDTHHLRGTNCNNPKDLQALCIGCHAEQPGEQHLKLIFFQTLRYQKRYQAFMTAYAPEWQMRFENQMLRPPEE